MDLPSIIKETLESSPDIAKCKLSMVAISYSSGEPNRYVVAGLPAGAVAEIMLGTVKKQGVMRQIWKVKVHQEARFKGAFATAEEALGSLQAHVDHDRQRHSTPIILR